ncbi:hypothetical protein SUDANB150_00071 [Streptomyces sp. enrichment culture]
MALVLVRNPTGRVLVVAGGLGTALVALIGLLQAQALGGVLRFLLGLLALAAVVTTVQAALSPGPARVRPSA